MLLEEIPNGEKVFIDSNIPTYLLFNDPRYEKSVESFLKKIEHGLITGFFNLTVFDETLFNFIKAGVIKKHGSEVRFNDYYKQNPDMLLEINTSAVLRIFQMDNMNLISMDDLTLVMRFSKRYSLLPADAINVATMEANNITHLASNDTDFEKIEWIKLYKPSR